jgi:hypothetical protein
VSDHSRSENPFEQPVSPSAYSIRRKGSLYNIVGPHGREFVKYVSAKLAGPRWEELTHTPWPYPSSAYEPGLRLWQLGVIDRHQVGQRRIETPFRREVPRPPSPVRRVWQMPVIRLCLPAPRIDLQEQARLMQTLRRDPARLFDPTIRRALQHEVEYHLTQAAWAAHLLKLLDRYERRQRHFTAAVSPQTITAQHIAWQEQQARTR